MLCIPIVVERKTSDHENLKGEKTGWRVTEASRGNYAPGSKLTLFNYKIINIKLFYFCYT